MSDNEARIFFTDDDGREIGISGSQMSLVPRFPEVEFTVDKPQNVEAFNALKDASFTWHFRLTRWQAFQWHLFFSKTLWKRKNNGT